MFISQYTMFQISTTTSCCTDTFHKFQLQKSLTVSILNYIKASIV
jgi:hypothetical protein